MQRRGKVKLLEEAMEIDLSTGKSQWWDIKILEEKIGLSLHGNGSDCIQEDRGLGKKYLIEKARKESSNEIDKVRTIGKVVRQSTHKAPTTKDKSLCQDSCAMCGDRDTLERDHKDGRGDEDFGFQSLCKHCNDLKRDICRRCKKTNERFDAKSIGYTKSWITGNKRFNPYDPRCKGCYWFSPTDFRKILECQTTKIKQLEKKKKK